MNARSAPEFGPADGSPIPAASSVGAGPDPAGQGSTPPCPAGSLPIGPFVSSEVETPSYIPVRAAEDMLRVRSDQIFRHGHTPEADLARPLLGFALDLEAMTRAIVDDVHYRKDAARIRRRLIKLGAVAMATVDRLDGDPALSPSAESTPR